MALWLDSTNLTAWLTLTGDRFDGILAGDIGGLLPLGRRQVEDSFQDRIEERGETLNRGSFERSDFPPQAVGQMSGQGIERFWEVFRQTRRGNQASAMS
jgi:hypothetical protein